MLKRPRASEAFRQANHTGLGEKSDFQGKFSQAHAERAVPKHALAKRGDERKRGVFLRTVRGHVLHRGEDSLAPRPSRKKNFCRPSCRESESKYLWRLNTRGSPRPVNHGHRSGGQEKTHVKISQIRGQKVLESNRGGGEGVRCKSKFLSYGDRDRKLLGGEKKRGEKKKGLI